jgi:hypothetical protein
MSKWRGLFVFSVFSYCSANLENSLPRDMQLCLLWIECLHFTCSHFQVDKVYLNNSLIHYDIIEI